MKIALGGVLSQLSLIAVGVDEHKGPGGEVKLVRSLVGVSKTDLPPDAVVWLNDATASRAEVEAVLGHAARDATPPGVLGPQHPVVQIVPKRDVTKERDPRAAADLLRGILHDLPHRRVGLLTHQKLAQAVPPLLGEPYRGRLVMTEYFGGGLSRGSNRWLAECDAVVVLGTPRVAPSAIREHLLRLGKVRAALRGKDETKWEPDWWSGVTESGRRVTVRTLHYRDHDWHAAYCSIVRGEVIQAVGRGRGILPAGIPVYLITTENLAPPDADDGRNGFRLADRPFAPLTAAHLRVLGLLARDGDVRGRPARIPVHRTTAEVAGHLGVRRQAAHKVLAELEKAGRVRRIRPNLGWFARP